jgi:hypothetical protein
MTVIIEQVALNKSNLLLKIFSQKTQTLQPLTKMVKVEIMYKSYLKDKLEGLGSDA